MRSSSSPPPRSFAPPLLAGVALSLIALVAMGWALGNQFVQDDSGVIAGNPLIRHWSGIWRAFGAPYWPLVTHRELYRPLSVAGYAVQWMVGGGTPILFRVVSLTLYLGSVLVLWRLLRTIVPERAAWLGAAVFAVHPVHVEAVTMAVNQSEILVGILLAAAVLFRIRANRGEASVARAKVAIWSLFLVATFVKEHALVLPGLLASVDLLIDRGPGDLALRWRRWRWHYLALGITGALFWMVRTRVLGPGSGTQTAEALLNAGLLERAHTMVGVPAEWLRLFLWPVHLQADWNLLEWVPSRGWSLRDTAGALAIASFVLALGLAWRRRPIAAFGLAWMAVALAPVSNLLIPTGIILAERTLFLPSIGFAIVVADLAGVLEGRWYQLPRPLRLFGLGLVVTLLGLGAIRSAVRFADWRNRPTFLAVQVVDAPDSWRARIAFGLLLTEIADTLHGRMEIRRAIRSLPDQPLIAKSLVDRMRLLKGECLGPTVVYEEILLLSPGRSDVRGSLVACQLWLGRWSEARAEAARGVASGLDPDYFRYVMTVADSAAAAHAGAATVRLRVIGKQATFIGPLPEALP
ncbi:MAG: hypothetical protein ABIQ41_03435 [Gemmatimonadales bacterium]